MTISTRKERRLSDHGLNYCCSAPCTEQQASAVFCQSARRLWLRHEKKAEQFCAYFLIFDFSEGWTPKEAGPRQLTPLAAIDGEEETRAALANLFGIKEHDGIGDWNQAEALCSFLDKLDQDSAAQNDHL